MKKEIKFIISSNLTVDNLHRLHLEVESRKNLIAFMIEKNMSLGEKFQTYQKEYQNFYEQYDKQKKQFQIEFVNPVLKKENIDASKAFWYIDFDSNEVTIVVNDE